MTFIAAVKFIVTKMSSYNAVVIHAKNLTSTSAIFVCFINLTKQCPTGKCFGKLLIYCN